MRRMTDIKIEDGKVVSIDGATVGGETKLYTHTISFSYNLDNKKSYVSFTMVTTQSSPIESFNEMAQILYTNKATYTASGASPSSEKLTLLQIGYHYSGNTSISIYYTVEDSSGEVKFQNARVSNYYVNDLKDRVTPIS